MPNDPLVDCRHKFKIVRYWVKINRGLEMPGGPIIECIHCGLTQAVLWEDWEQAPANGKIYIENDPECVHVFKSKGFWDGKQGASPVSGPMVWCIRCGVYSRLSWQGWKDLPGHRKILSENDVMKQIAASGRE